MRKKFCEYPPRGIKSTFSTRNLRLSFQYVHIWNSNGLPHLVVFVMLFFIFWWIRTHDRVSNCQSFDQRCSLNFNTQMHLTGNGPRVLDFCSKAYNDHRSENYGTFFLIYAQGVIQHFFSLIEMLFPSKKMFRIFRN